MIKRILLFCIPLLLVCSIEVSGSEKLSVYSVNYPLHYFAKRIGGDKVDAVFPAPGDIDPAFWAPDDSHIRAYQKADLILLNGAGYAKWTSRVSLPLLRSVDTSKLFRDDLIQTPSTITHSHGPGGDHSHGGTAFTTWLDFNQAALQAKAISEALSSKDPENKDYYQENFRLLESDLLDLDNEMSELLADKESLLFFASHPIYQYLARRYSMDIHMMMWEPDVDPGSAEWLKLKKMHKDHPAAIMIWEGEPLADSAGRLKEMGIEGMIFSPCFAHPLKGDFLSVMKSNIDNIRSAFTAAKAD